MAPHRRPFSSPHTTQTRQQQYWFLASAPVFSTTRRTIKTKKQSFLSFLSLNKKRVGGCQLHYLIKILTFFFGLFQDLALSLQSVWWYFSYCKTFYSKESRNDIDDEAFPHNWYTTVYQTITTAVRSHDPRPSTHGATVMTADDPYIYPTLSLINEQEH